MDLHFIYNLSILFNVVTGGVTALFLIFTAYRENLVARALTHLAIADVGWALTHFLAQVVQNPAQSLLFNKWSVFFTIFLPFYSLAFSIRSIESLTGKFHKYWYRVSQFLQCFFLIIITSDIFAKTGLLVNENNYPRSWDSLWPGRGTLFVFFPVFFLGCFLASFLLLRKALSNKDVSLEARQQIKIVNWSLYISSLGGSTFWLLWYEVPIPALSGWFVPLYILGLFYSITRFKLFNIKVVIAELSTIVIWMLLFAGMLNAHEKTELIYHVVTFIFALFFGILTIRSVISEVKQKEDLKQITKELDQANKSLTDLNVHLEDKVRKQTAEISKAYEIEKKARIELENLNSVKDQFILATQHHLRTPLTIMKGYLSVFLSKKQKLDLKTKESYVEKTLNATNRIAKLVNELLDVSQLQLGKKLLIFQPVDIKNIIEDVVENLQEEILIKKLVVKILPENDKDWPLIPANLEKLKIVFSNIIDNAVKYTPKGEIIIQGKQIDGFFQISVQDTGIGIDPEEIEGLFTQYFERGEQAQKIHTTGRGIGLFIAASVIKAHQGKIWAESEGRNKGAKFIIELKTGNEITAKN
ncbi:MAG: HAMP domain-containing sensor histidine kinase [Patescibacteria group bacterium]